MSDESVRMLWIKLLLLRQGIESNPGPVTGSDSGLAGKTKKKANLKVRTYNCNGLGKIDKLRRVFKKVHHEVADGGIVLLLETHRCV